MPGYKRPGVFVEETLSPANARSANGGTIAAFVGTYGRGLTTPTYLTSFTDFTNKYGPIDPSYDLGLAVFTYFGNGGVGAFINRVVGSSNGTAILTLSDRAGTPLPTLSASAISPGTWGNNLYVAISDTSVSGRFNLTVYYSGTTDVNVVETYPDLSMSASDTRYAVSIVNSQSSYLLLADLVSSTAVPNNVPSVRSASAGNAVLSGGANGNAPGATDYLSAVQAFDVVEGPLVLNVPGVSSTATLNPIITYCENRGDTFVVVDCAANRTPTQIVSDFSGATASSYAAVYYPRIKIADPVATVPNVTRTVPAGGSVIGAIMRTDTLVGPFQAPAGIDAGLIPATGIEQRLTPTDLDNLNTSTPPINPIRTVPGNGICVMGARTLKPGYADKYVPIRRSLIYIRKSLIDLMQFAVFQPNDERLWGRITDTVTSWLAEYYMNGGLRGNSSTQAFYVKCDSTINTSATIAAGAVYVEVGVALQYPAEFIVLRLGQFDGGAASITEVN